MTDTENTPSETPREDPLAQHRDTAVHLFVADAVLRDQLVLIFKALHFTNVTAHKAPTGYLTAIRDLSLLLMKTEGLFLVGPPLTIINAAKKTRTTKELPDFFASVSLLLTQAKRDPMSLLARCVPVFADIQFTQKRENTIVALAEYGVSGAFILKPQDSLAAMQKAQRMAAMREQVLERYAEIRDYLLDYLPHMEGALDELVQRKEERELSQRKTEADKWLEKAEKLRKADNLDQAIQCYKKAIDLYPAHPEAYLESGRVYVRMKKYPRALQRFRQAEEIALSMPEPNKEIAKVRVLQVSERIEAGDSPDNPELAEMLREAMENFEAAMDKAQKLEQMENPQSGKDRGADAMASVAGEIFKLDLSTLLGRNHPVAQKLSALARDALMSGAESGEMDPRQLILMGQAAMDAASYREAEGYFLKAAESARHFPAACDEMIHMGTLLRRHQGPEAAIALYERVIAMNPPSLAAAQYNLAVALAEDGSAPKASAAIIRALLTDPSLPENESFYKNHQLHPVLSQLITLFDTLAAKPRPEPGESQKHLMDAQAGLETAILGNDEKQAFRLLWNLVSKNPAFFKAPSVQASNTIREFLISRCSLCQASKKPEFQRFGQALAKIRALYDTKSSSAPHLLYMEHRAQALTALAANNTPNAGGHFTQALATHNPDALSLPESHYPPALQSLAKTIHTTLQTINPDHLK